MIRLVWVRDEGGRLRDLPNENAAKQVFCIDSGVGIREISTILRARWLSGCDLTVCWWVVNVFLVAPNGSDDSEWRFVGTWRGRLPSW